MLFFEKEINMIEVGNDITIGGRKGTIVFTANYNNTDYINVCYGEVEYEYKIYKVKLENEKVMVCEETDESILSELMSIFINEELDNRNQED